MHEDAHINKPLRICVSIELYAIQFTLSFTLFTLYIFLAIQQLPSSHIKTDLINVDKFLLLLSVVMMFCAARVFHVFFVARFIPYFNINLFFSLGCGFFLSLSSTVVLFACPLNEKKITMNSFFLSFSLWLMPCE